MLAADRGAAYDFGGATFDLGNERDREIVRFVLSQALYGEATGVYCGLSLYSARSLEAADFYVRQARQELAHLRLFADIFRALEMEPYPGHWVIRLLSSHNDYYPLKVLVEHAIGEGLVLDVFKELLLATLPDDDPRVPGIKKKLRVVCNEEAEHVGWGERETLRILERDPWMRTPFYGLFELHMMTVPLVVRALRAHSQGHPVLEHLDGFVRHVQGHAWDQGRRLGYLPEKRPGPVRRSAAIAAGVALLVRSRFARRRSHLEKIYLHELGFADAAHGAQPDHSRDTTL